MASERVSNLMSLAGWAIFLVATINMIGRYALGWRAGLFGMPLMQVQLGDEGMGIFIGGMLISTLILGYAFYIARDFDKQRMELAKLKRLNAEIARQRSAERRS